MKVVISRVVLVLSVVLLAACESQQIYKEPARVDLVGISKSASDVLAAELKQQLPNGATILSTSLADINELDTTSTFGRIVGEQISSGLRDHDYKLIEIKMRNKVYVAGNKAESQGSSRGEFGLSRELAAISKNYHADAVLAGTYALGSRTVYVSARLIDTSTNQVLSTVDFQLPMDSDIRTLTNTR